MNERIKDFFKYADSSGMVDIFRCRHYITRPDKINSLEQCKQADKATVNEIDDLKRLINFLQEYRIELFNRYQEIVSTNYRLRLTLKREINYYKNKKFYYIYLEKVYDREDVKPEELLQERFDGTERHKALNRFAELQKQYPNIEIIKNINKKHWEK